jgi:DNA-binding NarL/FixJ family response regulator
MERMQAAERPGNIMDREEYPEKKPVILIVEDHEGMRNSMKRWMSTIFQEYEVVDVSTGEEAMELCRAKSPYLILMDIKLPGINGIEASRAIKAFAPHTKIIVITIYDTGAFKESALGAGADRFLSKNRISTELIPVMKEMLSSFTTEDG